MNYAKPKGDHNYGRGASDWDYGKGKGGHDFGKGKVELDYGKGKNYNDWDYGKGQMDGKGYWDAGARKGKEPFDNGFKGHDAKGGYAWSPRLDNQQERYLESKAAAMWQGKPGGPGPMHPQPP